MTTTAPTLPTPQTKPALPTRGNPAPNPTSTPTAPPGSLGRLSVAALELARSEALRDADVLAMGLRAGISGFRGVQAVTALRGLRVKLAALEGELLRRGEPVQ